MSEKIMIAALLVVGLAFLLAALRWLNDASTGAAPHIKAQVKPETGQLRADIMAPSVPVNAQHRHAQGLLLCAISFCFFSAVTAIFENWASFMLLAFVAFAVFVAFVRCLLKLRSLGRSLL